MSGPVLLSSHFMSSKCVEKPEQNLRDCKIENMLLQVKNWLKTVLKMMIVAQLDMPLGQTSKKEIELCT